MSIFKSKKQISVDIADFNASHISTGIIGAYIKKLYKEEKFLHIGYRLENKDGLLRYILYTLPDSKIIIQYFKDRCHAMIEKECMDCEPEAHYFSTWPNGFQEVVPFEKDK